MQANTLKVKTKKKRKTIGRGGKKGTYCGKGMKGQKARSGGNVDPLFEGGRSTLIDHMKKKKGFKSRKPKAVPVSLERIEKKFKDGETVNRENLEKNGFIGKIEKKVRIKILGVGTIKKKLTIAKEIQCSTGAKEAIEKVGGKVETEK